MHRHLVMFASLFLFLWAVISIGCPQGSLKVKTDFRLFDLKKSKKGEPEAQITLSDPLSL
jgi:hypothetical protein